MPWASFRPDRPKPRVRPPAQAGKHVTQRAAGGVRRDVAGVSHHLLCRNGVRVLQDAAGDSFLPDIAEQSRAVIVLAMHHAIGTVREVGRPGGTKTAGPFIDDAAEVHGLVAAVERADTALDGHQGHALVLFAIREQAGHAVQTGGGIVIAAHQGTVDLLRLPRVRCPCRRQMHEEAVGRSLARGADTQAEMGTLPVRSVIGDHVCTGAFTPRQGAERLAQGRTGFRAEHVGDRPPPEFHARAAEQPVGIAVEFTDLAMGIQVQCQARLTGGRILHHHDQSPWVLNDATVL